MATLLIRFSAPLQSWGVQSRFYIRDTCKEPTKSGIVGILASALGRKRDNSLEDLNNLNIAIRVDREGKIKKDYHTILEVLRADGKSPKKNETVLSDRYYLMDAEFLIGLEGKFDFLEEIKTAIENPQYPLFLGRKSCLPSKPIFLPDIKNYPSLSENNLDDVIRQYPLITNNRMYKDVNPETLRLVKDSIDETGSLRQDIAISFSERLFMQRYMSTDFIALPKERLEDFFKED